MIFKLENSSSMFEKFWGKHFAFNISNSHQQEFWPKSDKKMKSFTSHSYENVYAHTLYPSICWGINALYLFMQPNLYFIESDKIFSVKVFSDIQSGWTHEVFIGSFQLFTNKFPLISIWSTQNVWVFCIYTLILFHQDSSVVQGSNTSYIFTH